MPSVPVSPDHRTSTGCDAGACTDLPRRRLLIAGAAAGAAAALTIVPRVVRAQTLPSPPDELANLVKAFTQGAVVLPGKVKLDISPLVDNGNSVPVTISVDSPMTADSYVRQIAMFNEKNPQRDVFRAQLSPRSGKASVSTRIRLANSQKLVAIAQLSDGTWWSHSVDVLVTLAACIDLP
jgi:sulfur-oxidizing protein SoxY